MAKPTIPPAVVVKTEPTKISDGTATGATASDSVKIDTIDDEALISAVRELKDVLTQFQADRASYIALLTSMTHFMEAVWGDEARQPLQGLAFALSDLDQGTVAPFLAPVRGRARPPDSTEEWVRRAHLSLALECRVKGGEDTQIAAAMLAHTAGVEARQLINWRRQFQAGRVKNRYARLLFERLSQDIKTLDRTNLRVIATRFMNFSRRPI